MKDLHIIYKFPLYYSILFYDIYRNILIPFYINICTYLIQTLGPVLMSDIQLILINVVWYRQIHIYVHIEDHIDYNLHARERLWIIQIKFARSSQNEPSKWIIYADDKLPCVWIILSRCNFDQKIAMTDWILSGREIILPSPESQRFVGAKRSFFPEW